MSRQFLRYNFLPALFFLAALVPGCVIHPAELLVIMAVGTFSGVVLREILGKVFSRWIRIRVS